MEIQEEKKLRIPYASPGAAGQAIDLFRRMTPQKITTKFIADNGLATVSNAFTLTDTLLWLGIIDRAGNVNIEVAQKLKLVGKDKEEFMKELIKKSYVELFNAMDLMQVSRNDIQNFIVNHYGFGQAQARYAAILFLNFCQTYGIEMAEELKKKQYKFSERKKGERKEKKSPGAGEGEQRGKKQPEDSPTLDNPYKNNGNNGEKIMIVIRAPGINFPFYAKNIKEFDEIVKNKLPKAIQGVRSFLELMPEEEVTPNE